MTDFANLLRARRVQWVFVAAAVSGTVIGLDTLVLHLRTDPFADVRAYYDAGTRLNAGLSLYEQPATTDEPAFYRYPPLLAIAFRPLALLPFDSAAFLWEVLLIEREVLLILALVGTILRLGIRRRLTWLMVGWLAPLIGWSLVIGQAQVLVTFLLTLGSPLAVATAAHLKILPILAAVYWAGRRDLRSVARLCGWVAGLALLSFILEPRGMIEFIGFSDMAQVGNVRNISPYAFSPFLWLALVGALASVAWWRASTSYGWAAAIALVVFATPRLLLYQLSTLMAAARPTADYTARDVESDQSWPDPARVQRS